MSCTSGCPTQDCPSYAACLKGKGVKVAYANSANGVDYTKEKKWNREIERARSVMAQGILPDNTFGSALDRAERASELTGTPYRADQQ